MFEKYYKDSTYNTLKLQCNYIGINRKKFPKWQGWKIITNYKKNGIDIKEIRDNDLDILVRNFYYIKYLNEKFYK